MAKKAKSIKEAAAESDLAIAAEQAGRRKYVRVKPISWHVTYAENGYTLDSGLEGATFYVAKTPAEVAEIIEKGAHGIPAYEDQIIYPEIIDTENE